MGFLPKRNDKISHTEAIPEKENINSSRIHQYNEVRMVEVYQIQFFEPPLIRVFDLNSFGFDKNVWLDLSFYL